MEFLGLILPAFIDLINRKVADKDLRWWISLGVCAVFGVFVNFLNTSFKFETPLFGFESITTSIMMVFGLAQVSYQAIWENSSVRETLKLDATKK